MNTPTQLGNLNEQLFGQAERGRIEVGQPRNNLLVTAAYDLKRLTLVARAHRFGEVTSIAARATGTARQVPNQTYRAKVITDKMRTISEEKARKLVERLVSGAKLDEAATEAGATIQTAQGLRRNESASGFDVGAVTALFAVPENGFAFAVEPDGKGAKVMQSQPVLLPSFNPDSEEAKALSKQLEGTVSNDVLFAYLGSVEAASGTSINETLWRQISGTQTQ